MEKHVTLLALLAVLNIPVYLLFGKFCFGSWEKFTKCIGFWLKPDWMSWFDGSYTDDILHEFVLWIFCALCGGIVYGEYYLVTTFFSHG